MKNSRLILLPYNKGSASAKALAEKLTLQWKVKVRRWTESSKGAKLLPRHIIMRWGSSATPKWTTGIKCWNRPEALNRARNKLTTFKTLSGQVPVPEFTTDMVKAKEWISSGDIVVARGTLTGQGGQGISLHGTSFDAPLPKVPLYVRYKPKKGEYRVHVMFGNVIDVSKKVRPGGEELSPYVRNSANGWVFAHGGFDEPAGLRDCAVNSVNLLGLDFGAVDVIWNHIENKCYVLEVNTAPGIEGTTLERYADQITKQLYY